MVNGPTPHVQDRAWGACLNFELGPQSPSYKIYPPSSPTLLRHQNGPPIAYTIDPRTCAQGQVSMAVPSSLVIRVNVRTLLVVLVLTVPLILIDMVLVLDRTRTELTSVSGEHLQTMAESTAAGVSRYIDTHIRAAHLLAADRQLRFAVARANRAYPADPDEQLIERYEQIDRDWQTPKVASSVSALMGTDASVSLREYLELNPSLTRVVVTDRAGASVAASHKPGLYYHGDQAWWLASLGDSRTGAVHLTDTHWDPVAGAQSIAVSVPMLDPDPGRVAGILRLFVNLDDMPAGGPAQLHHAGEVIVAKRDGTVLCARASGSARSTESEEMESIRLLLADHPAGYSVVSLRGGEQRFVGFADVGLALRFADIDWAVLVAHNWDEASEPIEHIQARALISGLLAILLVGAIAVFFTTHRPARSDPLEQLTHTGQSKPPAGAATAETEPRR